MTHHKDWHSLIQFHTHTQKKTSSETNSTQVYLFWQPRHNLVDSLAGFGGMWCRVRAKSVLQTSCFWLTDALCGLENVKQVGCCTFHCVRWGLHPSCERKNEPQLLRIIIITSFVLFSFFSFSNIFFFFLSYNFSVCRQCRGGRFLKNWNHHEQLHQYMYFNNT